MNETIIELFFVFDPKINHDCPYMHIDAILAPPMAFGALMCPDPGLNRCQRLIILDSQCIRVTDMAC
jgi:hypothetical protein